MTVVIDASAAFAGLVRGSDHSDWVVSVISEHGIIAPDLALIELTQIVRRGVVQGKMTDEFGRQVVSTFSDLVDDFYPHRPLMDHIWEHRHAMSAYDGTYVALAALLHLPLVTLDNRLVRGAYRLCDILRPPAG